MTDACPSQEQLERMLVDRLAAPEAEAVERHVAGCAQCQRVLESLTAEDPAGEVTPEAAGAEGEGDSFADRLGRMALAAMPSSTRDGRPPGLELTIASAMEVDPQVPRSSRWPAIPGYEIRAELGRGGMGVVFLASQVKAKRLVALKMILNTAWRRAEDRLRFEIEVEALAQLKHPNIVAVYEVGAFEDQPYFSLEYVDGGTLAQALARAERPPSARRAAEMVETLARAVHSAHQCGIVHRDLKPANILLSRDRDADSGAASDDPGWGTVKIADFGLAKQIGGDNGLTQTGQVLGTPSYMAPEQASSGGTVGTPADVHALGAILHELMVGRPPFKADTPWETMMQLVHQPVLPPSHWRKGVPRDLETICLRCLEKDPGRRYPGAHALADDLRRYLAGEPIRARRVGEVERVWKWARRRPAVAGLMALALASLVAGTAISTVFGLAARQQAQAARMSEGQARSSALAAGVARDRAEASAMETSRQATRSVARSALAAAEAGEIDRGLFGLLDALEAAPDRSPEDRAFRVGLARNLAGWQAAQPVLRHVFDQVEKARFVGAGGRELALISGRRLRRVDLVTGRPIGEPDGREFPGAIVDVSPDGRAVLVSKVMPQDPSARWLGLHDSDTGRLRAEHRIPPDRPGWEIDSTQFGPGNRVIALRHGTPQGKGVTTCWRVDRGDLFEPRTAASEPVIEQDLRLLHGRNGRTILGLVPMERNALPPTSTGLTFWDVDAGRPIDGFEPEPGSSGPECVFDGTALITVTMNPQRRLGRVHWWDPRTGRAQRHSWRPVGALVAPTLTEDGRTLVAGCDDGRVRWFDLATGRDCGIALEAEVTGIAPQGAFVLGLDQGELRVWQAPGPLRPSPKDDAGKLRLNYISVDIRRDDGAVLVGQNNELATMGRILHLAVFSRGVGGQRGAQLFDGASGRPLAPPLFPCDRQSVFSRDGRLVGACRTQIMRHEDYEPTLIGVWEADSGRPIMPPTRFSHYVHEMAFSPDGRVLAVGVVSGLFLLDVATGRATRFLDQPGPIARIEFSPDGRLVAAGSRYGWPDERHTGVRIWDVGTGRPVGPLWPCKQLPFFRFSPDGRELLVLDVADRRVVRFDAATGRSTAEAHHLDDGQSEATAAIGEWDDARRSIGFDFRPDGMALAESRLSTVARQWDMATGRSIGPPLRHGAPVIWIEYSPDGSTLACGGTDGTVRLWDAPSGQPLGPALPHALPLLGLRFSRDGRTLIVVMTDGRPNSWPVPGPIATDEPERIRTWLETTRGVRGHDGGEFLDPMSRSAWLEGRDRLRSVWPSVPAAPDPRAMLARWHAARAADAERGGDGNAARRHLDDLAALEADDWLLHARRARTFGAEGRLPEADSEYARAARLAPPGDLTAWYWRAAFDAMNQDRSQAAIWYMDRVAAARPDDPRVFAQRAEMNDRLGKPAEADADRRRSLALRPDLATILDLADERAIVGDWSRARELFESADERSRAGGTVGPPEGETAAHHALACLHHGDRVRYRRICERLVAIGPDPAASDPRTAYSLAWVCVLAPGALDEPGRAVRLAERSLAAFISEGGKSTVLSTLGGALYRAGRPSEAIARLEEGIRLRGGRSLPQDWAFLAMAHQALGDNPGARTWLSRFDASEATPSWETIAIDLLRHEAEAKVLYDPVFPADVFRRQ